MHVGSSCGRNDYVSQAAVIVRHMSLTKSNHFRKARLWPGNQVWNQASLLVDQYYGKLKVSHRVNRPIDSSKAHSIIPKTNERAEDQE